MESAIAKVEVKLLNELDKIYLAMESMEVFIKNSESVNYPNFKELTNPFLEDLNGLLLLGWRPQTADTGIQDYLTNQNQPPDSITSQEYEFLNKVIQPLAEAALQSRKTIISEPVDQWNEAQSIPGFLSIISVYDSTELSVQGVCFGVFDMERLARETLRYELPILDISVSDNAKPEVSLFNENLGGQTKDDHTQVVNLNAGSRSWALVLNPKPIYRGYPHSTESYFVLLLGIFSTILLVLVLKQRDEYLSRLSQEVWRRTKDLEESNKLKENLLREIHHRVKNNLQIASSLINLQKRRLTDPEMIEAFSNSQGRILAIAMIHEKIYEHKETKAVDLKSYLEVLMKYHQKMSPQVTYDIECPEIAIDLDTAVPIALISSELVVNALKHAFPEDMRDNHITLNVLANSGVIALSIIDNGLGLPKQFDINNTEGIGFEIVKKLCRQIDATFSFRSTETGTNFNILFKQKG